ncbi:MAG: hypothetical protein JXR58_04370 [Bacteroidales bacterium]|nr:hypothetical protein [Bacteroidales bacterium]
MKKAILFLIYSIFVFFQIISGAKNSKLFSRNKLLIGIAIISLLKISTSCRNNHHHRCYVAVFDPEVKEQSDTTKTR